MLIIADYKYIVSTVGSVAYSSSRFGPGSGPIFMTTLQCTGQEQSIINCSYTPPQVSSSCSHSRDVGLSCEGMTWNYRALSLLMCNLSIAN